MMEWMLPSGFLCPVTFSTPSSRPSLALLKRASQSTISRSFAFSIACIVRSKNRIKFSSRADTSASAPLLLSRELEPIIGCMTWSAIKSLEPPGPFFIAGIRWCSRSTRSLANGSLISNPCRTKGCFKLAGVFARCCKRLIWSVGTRQCNDKALAGAGATGSRTARRKLAHLP